MQAADPEPPGHVTALGGAVSQIQTVQANIMAAPVCDIVDHSAETGTVHAIACQFSCEKQELVGVLRQMLELFDEINGNIRTQKRERSTRFFVLGLIDDPGSEINPKNMSLWQRCLSGINAIALGNAHGDYSAAQIVAAL